MKFSADRHADLDGYSRDIAKTSRKREITSRGRYDLRQDDDSVKGSANQEEYRAKSHRNDAEYGGLETRDGAVRTSDGRKKTKVSRNLNDHGTKDSEEVDSNSASPAEDDLSNFRISEQTASKLRAINIHRLFPIQVKCIDPILDGNDVLGRARTGTGKTLAFSLPIIEILIKNDRERSSGDYGRTVRFPRALIMVPTRELALQVNKVISGICGRLRSLCVYGGTPYLDQIRPLERGVDIVVGTPGRLIDLIERGTLKLSDLKFVCLDEADQMLDIGFAEDMDRILERVREEKKLPKEGFEDLRDYQVLLFSATVPNWINKVVKNYMRKDMLFVDLVSNTTETVPNTIKHYAVNVRWKKRPSVIHDVAVLYGDQNSKSARTIIFAEKKGDCNVIAMEEKLSSCGIQAIHGDISQKQREATVQGFRDGKFKYLVATNVCARGIDIPEVDLIINCEPPGDVESYIHRSGRTGRAGRPGVCVTLYSPFQEYQINNIRNSAGIDFVVTGPPQQEEILLKSLEPSLKSMISMSENDPNPIFISHAKRLLEEIGDPVAAISAILSVHFNVDSKIRPRSILTDAEGFYTLVFRTDQVAHSIGYIRSIIQRRFPDLDVQNDISNMVLAEDNRSAVVDINFEKIEVERDADGNKQIYIAGVPCDSIRGVSIEIAKDLPKLRPKPVSRERTFNGNRGFARRGITSYRNQQSR